MSALCTCVIGPATQQQLHCKSSAAASRGCGASDAVDRLLGYIILRPRASSRKAQQPAIIRTSAWRGSMSLPLTSYKDGALYNRVSVLLHCEVSAGSCSSAILLNLPPKHLLRVVNLPAT